MPAQLDPNTAIAFLAGFLAALLMGRGLVRVLVPLMRLLGKPFRMIGRGMRRLGILRRPRSTRVASDGATVLERGLAYQTEVERSLARVDHPAEGQSAIHDFGEEEKLLRRVGVLFQSIRIGTDYLPAHLTGPLTEEIAETYVHEAKTFFAVPVTLTANEKSLYEDAEGSFIVSLFRSVDRRCYFLLNEMRKTINGNARNLALVFTAMLYGWLAFALWCLVQVVGADPNAADAVPLYSNKWALAALGSAVATLILMFLIQNNGYRQQQQHNVRELRFFLTRYLGRIADRYRESTGNAKQVTVGDERDPKTLSDRAQRWHKIMIWIPFRTFFIESFVRNIKYQIARNTGYYMIIPYTALALLAVGGLLAYTTTDPNITKFYSDVLIESEKTSFAIVLLLVGGIVTFFYWERINAEVIGNELSQLDWLGYENLNVSSAMDDVVGKYAEDVGFWKGRMKL